MVNDNCQLLDKFNNISKKAAENWNNIQEKFEKAKNQARHLEPIVNKYVDIFDGFVHSFARKSLSTGKDAEFFKNLFENYFPVTFYLLASSVVSAVFGNIVGWFLGFVLTRSSAACLSSLIIPYLIVYYISTVRGSEKDRRMLMLLATVVESLMMEFVWPGCGLRFVAPPIFLFCLGSMFVFHSKAHGRPGGIFLAVIIGVPVYFYLFIYVRLVSRTFGQLYHVWLMVVGGAAIMDINAKMTQFLRGQTATVKHQGVSVAVIMLATFVMTFISSLIVGTSGTKSMIF